MAYFVLLALLSIFSISHVNKKNCVNMSLTAFDLTTMQYGSLPSNEKNATLSP